MLQTFEFATPEGMIRIERTYQEINVAGPVADEKWRFTDSNGHKHHYSSQGDGHYPTLVYVAGPVYYCAECNDEHEDYAVSHWECRICHEEVTPGSREPRNPEATLLTSQAAYLDGEVIPRERAERILSDALTAQRNDGNVHEVRLS